jgi:ligand-binding SRPBCC domain-containing protein
MSFHRSFRVSAPLDAVRRFHQNPTALKRLNPPPLLVRFHRHEPLAEGSISEFTLWLGPVPVRWTSRHFAVGLEGFTDEQLRGPFRRWVHRHQYRALSEHETRVEDEIDAELRMDPWFGPLGLILWLGLPILFAYRAWATRRAVRRARGSQ